MPELLNPVDTTLQGQDRELSAIFPTPRGIEGVWLVRALLEVFEAVPWMRPLLGGDGNRETLQAILKSRSEAVPQGQLEARRRELTGDYEAAGIMVGRHGERPVRAIQTLRALVWLVLLDDHRVGRRSATHTKHLAQGLRKAAKAQGSSGSALDDALGKLASVNSLDGAIEALSHLGKAQAQTLRDVWVEWLYPTLRTAAAGAPRGANDPPGPEDGQPPPRGPQIRPAGQQTPRAPRTPKVERLLRRHPFEGQLADEPSEEFTTATELVTLRDSAASSPQSIKKFYAQRAIWSGNTHLLTNHIDALPGPIFSALLRWLVDGLQETPPGGGVALGSVCCLLKALTGRTSDGLKAFRVGPIADAPWDHQGCIDIDAGLIWLPVFWKLGDLRRSSSLDGRARVSYFRPGETQRALLAPTSDRIALPLPSLARQVFKRHKATLQTLASADSRVMDDAMARALRAATERLELVASVAGLRRALGPLLNERFGDAALAQLICGESFGLTTAPLHYYAPTMRRVAEAYHGLFVDCLGPSPMPRIPAWGTRVGSELMITPATARELATSSSGARVVGQPDGLVSSVCSKKHQQLVDHLARMILATSGHRPSLALFEITLADIDLTSGAALFRDKRHDVAHDPRLAALPRITTDQIRAYLDHLGRLGAVLPELASLLTSILQGERPLLFDLDSSGRPRPLSLDVLAERSPAVWKTLPWNWSRTWIRTAAVESGAPAWLVAAQLGHFDSIGYPYSNQSPTDPIELVEATRPWLDLLARRAGWAVLESGLAPKPGALVECDPAPLEDWTVRLDNADASASKAHRAWENRIKTERHRLRLEAIEAVLENPEVTATGLAASYRDQQSTVPREALRSLDVEAVRDALVLDAGDDAIVAVARIRALGSVLKSLASRARLPVPNLPIPVPVRRPLDNPFFPGACRALSQVTTLRAHIGERRRRAAPPRTFELQVARTAEALALFGGVDNDSTLIEVLAARTRALPSARYPDMLFVPLDDGRIVHLRDGAALAMAALAQEFPEQPLPSRQAVDATLRSLMPAWATRPSRGSVLKDLCSTMRVCNRFELSPAARFAMDEEHGSVQACLEEQLALTDGDVIGPVRPPSSTVDESSVRGSVQDDPALRLKGDTPRRQYSEVLRMIPRRGHELRLPLTGCDIAASSLNRRATRDAVVAELRAWLDSTERGAYRVPIVRMLAEWTFAELKRPLPRGGRLADRTVATYLSRIGSALVRMLGDTEPSQWDETSFEDAYAYALESSKYAKHKVAAALLSFHRFSEARFDLPEVDLGGVYAVLGPRERNVDAALILPAERERALDELRRRAWRGANETEARQGRLAGVTAEWLARTGLRLSEPLGFRVRDLGRMPDNTVYAYVRSNRMRRLKTQSGRRMVALKAASKLEQDVVWEWRAAIRSKAKPSRSGGAYLSAELDRSRSFGEHGGVSRLIRAALAAQTGRSSERLHRLRHIVAHESLEAVTLSSEDAAKNSQAVFKPAGVLEPRDFAAVSVPMGHWHWMTTLQSYLHVPWILQSRSTARRRRLYFNRRFLPGTLGYSAAFFDSLLRDRPGVSKETAWFGRFRTGRIQARYISPETETPSKRPARSARQMGCLFDLASRCSGLSEALRLSGLSMSDEAAIRRHAFAWELKVKRRLLPPGNIPGGQMQRSLRRDRGDALAEKLWDVFDRDPAGGQDILAIAHAAFVHADPQVGERLRLPDTQVEGLVRLLSAVGISETDIHRERLGPDLSQVTVLSAKKDKRGRPRRVGMRRVLALLAITAALQE